MSPGETDQKRGRDSNPVDEVTPWKVGADERLLLGDWFLWIEVTPWKVGADEKLLLRDSSL